VREEQSFPVSLLYVTKGGEGMDCGGHKVEGRERCTRHHLMREKNLVITELLGRKRAKPETYRARTATSHKYCVQ